MLKFYIEAGKQLFNATTRIALPNIMLNKALFFTGYLVTFNPCIVDSAWVFSHLVVAATYAFTFGTASTMGSLFALSLVALWAFRLGGFLFFTRVWNKHMDTRYEPLANIIGEKLRHLGVFGQFIFQGLLMSITSLPLYYLFKSPVVFSGSLMGAKNVVGAGIAVAGIIGQAIADHQLQDFKNKRKSGEIPKSVSIFREGVWVKSRHPNLFFELVTWGGFSLMSKNPKILNVRS